MEQRHSVTRAWRFVAAAGVFLIAVGVSAFYVDVAAAFQFDFISRHYEEVGTGILLGVVLAFAGFIGWARLCSTRHRKMMAAFVFISPFAALLVGSPIAGTNIHGPSAITMMLTIPATILAIILLIMATIGGRVSSSN